MNKHKSYILIKKYPGSPDIDAIAKQDSSGMYIVRSAPGVMVDSLMPFVVEDNPEFWYRIKEVDTPILDKSIFINILRSGTELSADVFASMEEAAKFDYTVHELVKTVTVPL